jgi:hypothetical protein
VKSGRPGQGRARGERSERNLDAAEDFGRCVARSGAARAPSFAASFKLNRTRDRNRGIGGWPAVDPPLVESNPGIRLVNGVPLILIVGVVAIAIVAELLGGIIFDFDVNTVYRNVFRKLDEMVAERRKS